MYDETLKKLEIKGVGMVHCGALVVDDVILLAELFGAKDTLTRITKPAGTIHHAVFCSDEIQFAPADNYESEIVSCGVNLYPNAARTLIYHKRFSNTAATSGSEFWAIASNTDQNEENQVLWNALKEISPICLLDDWQDFLLDKIQNHQSKIGIHLDNKRTYIKNGLSDKVLYRLTFHPDKGKKMFCEAITSELKSGALPVPQIPEQSFSEVQKCISAKRAYSDIQGYKGPQKAMVKLTDIL